MAITINALTTGVGGLETTADASGSFSFQSDGTTIATVTSSGFSVTGTFNAGNLQVGGSDVVVDTDIGSTVQAYDATILKSADIGTSVQGYDADTAKYDDVTANFTGNLQKSGANVLTSNQTITLSGDVTGSGTTAITTTVANDSHSHTTSTLSGNVSAFTNDSGYITGNQTITLSGDASGSGTTAITVTVADNSHNHTSANISDATSANTANTIVERNASGNFSAGTITATLSGNATTATTATNVSGGSVSATTGSFSGLITTATNGASFGSANDTTLSIRGSGSFPATFSFHRPGVFATNFGIDTDNQLKVGGWSLGGPYPIIHSNNFSSYGITRTTGSPAYYAARAFVNWNGQGTVAIRDSQNVTSITDGGTGTYTVNFTTAMPDANYTISTSSSADNSNVYVIGTSLTTAPATTNWSCNCGRSGLNFADPLYANATFFR